MIRFKEVNVTWHKEPILQWESGSYNTMYFENPEEREENIQELRRLKKNFSTWTEKDGRFALQFLQ